VEFIEDAQLDALIAESAGNRPDPQQNVIEVTD
jgi:hypothetical protein